MPITIRPMARLIVRLFVEFSRPNELEPGLVQITETFNQVSGLELKALTT
jgi:hypothetical protein